MRGFSTTGMVAMLLLGGVTGLVLRAPRGAEPPAPPPTSAPPPTTDQGKDDPSGLLEGVEGYVDLKNPICPVMGNPVNASKPVWLAYNGAIVRFCCGGCDRTFLEKPLSYLRELAEQGVAVPSRLLEPEAHPEVIEARNAICPIMENPIEKRGKVFMVHNGVLVDFCCPPCIEEFARDPVAGLRKTAESGEVPEDRIH